MEKKYNFEAMYYIIAIIINAICISVIHQATSTNLTVLMIIICGVTFGLLATRAHYHLDNYLLCKTKYDNLLSVVKKHLAKKTKRLQND